MESRLRWCGVAILVVVMGPGMAAGQRAGGRVVGRWLGQDGHDLIGPSPAPAPAPNEVQDIHLQVGGLPPGRTVKEARLVGLGGGEWVYNAPGGHWRLEVVKPAGSPTADLYFEVGGPETGRPWNLSMTLDDGRTVEVPIRGGKADPNRRMAAATVQARWVGQGPEQDRCGPGPAVGPDGRQDARIEVARLSPRAEVKAVVVEAPGLPGWAYGTNPELRANAELVRREGEGGRADLYLQPSTDLAGATLRLTITYADGKTDRAAVAASATDPGLRVKSPPEVRLAADRIEARWVGQDGRGGTPGLVHLALAGLPRDRVVAAVALSGAARGSWFHRASDRLPFQAEPYAGSLAFRRLADPTRADLFFPPDRDETGGTMTLRLVYGDGRQAVVRFLGGACDPGLWTDPKSGPSKVQARPGQDLQGLVDRAATVELAAGTYALDRPLVLRRPVTLRAAAPGTVTLRFRQPAGAEPWTTAIKIHAGHTTLEGFAVRFEGGVRWRQEVSYGPAVIGTTDNLDPPPGRDVPIADVTLQGLDLEGPAAGLKGSTGMASAAQSQKRGAGGSGGPVTRPEDWEEAVRLGRLVTARNGRVEKCTLRGGTIEVAGGPWTFVGNEHRGTPPGTVTPTVFAAHDGHDLVIADNHAHTVSPAGKTWRFLVMTGSGFRDRVERNRVEGLGPRDDDTIPSMNAPEIVLTEAYRLHFEGMPLRVSDEGRLLQIPEPQGEPARTGDVVAVLSGPNAGSWHRVAQAIDARTYLVDPPLKGEEAALAIATGFVDPVFLDNTIDSRGGSVAVNLVLVGNLYGAEVRGNRLIGAGEAFRIAASASEAPVHWGWSHNHFLGASIAGNTIEDSLRGGLLTVEHGPPVKAGKGRVYFRATFEGNRSVWTRPEPPKRPAFTMGDAGSKDPGELVLTSRTNTVTNDAGEKGASVRVNSATINGQAVTGQGFRLPEAASPAP